MGQHDETKRMLELIRESKSVSNRNTRLIREADERNAEDKDLGEDLSLESIL